MSTKTHDPEVAARAADAVTGGEPLGPLNARALAASGWRALRQGGNRQRVGRVMLEWAQVMRGNSAIEPERQDWRFRDPTWHDNPAYRRVMQLYLAWVRELDDLAAGAKLDWRDAERARFLATAISSALAPTNWLAGNPEALKRAFETCGISLFKGGKQLVHDVRHNGGLPSMVKDGAFTIGEDLAVTPGAVVHRDEVCEVIQYQPSTPFVRTRPMLMVPPQINKYYFMDLARGRSFVEHAVAHGIPYFTISWRNPSEAQKNWDLDTYAAAIVRAIDVARQLTHSDDVNLLSLCAGGITTTTVLNHLSETRDERVRSASFGVTLLDFAVPAPIGMFDSPPLIGLIRLRRRRSGVLEGRSLATMFTLMRPNDLMWNYWVNNYLLGKDPPTFDILAWNADTTNLPKSLHNQFLDIFSNNVLVHPGEMRVLGTPIDLGRIEVETYVTGATADHLTPWRGCYRTTQLLSGPSTFVLSNAGHIASLVNPPGNPKAHFFAGPEPVGDPDEWQAAAQEHQGTWWQHWASWVLERSGDERKAPGRLGSRAHPVIEAAPGSYVRGLIPPV